MTDTLRIDLGGGHFAIIDAVDAHLADWGWKARLCRTNNYAERRRARGGIQSLHRAVMGEPDGIVDHIDGDGFNCTRANLRTVSASENCRNVAGAPRNSTTGVLGVTRNERGRYVARIYHEGRSIQIGTFEHLEEARVARLYVEREFWGVQPRRAQEMAHLLEAERAAVEDSAS